MHGRSRDASILKSLLAWAVILCLAVANGTFREGVLMPALGKPAALIISGLMLSALVLLVAYGLVRACHGLSIAQGFAIGCIWLCLTLAFEFSFGRWVQHKSWAELFEAYTFQDGNIWPLVLVVVLLAPAVVAWLGIRKEGTT